jgi:hypothetical protein
VFDIVLVGLFEERDECFEAIASHLFETATDGLLLPRRRGFSSNHLLRETAAQQPASIQVSP